MSLSLAAPSTPSHLAVAQLLYTDGLHSIFKFLSLSELLPAITSCHSWRDAAYKEKSRGIGFKAALACLPGLLASPLRHHVSAITPGSTEKAPVYSLSNIPRLSALPCLTHLDALFTRISLLRAVQDRAGKADEEGVEDATAAVAAKWPSRLRWLRLGVNGPLSPKDAMAFTQLMVGLVSHLSTLMDLSLDFPKATGIDLAPLQRLPNLTNLTLAHIEVLSASARQLAQLSSLRYLSASDNQWTDKQLQALCCSEPCELNQLQELDLRSSFLNRIAMEALARLPSLTTIQPRFITLEALPLLGRFPLLRALRLEFDLPLQDVLLLSLIVPSLRACPQLTQLELVGFTIAAADDLAEFASALPLLRTLWFSGMGFAAPINAPDFSGLQSLQHLESITIDHCPHMRVEHLLQLKPIATLRSLTTRGLDFDVLEKLRALKAPSALLPQLTALNL